MTSRRGAHGHAGRTRPLGALRRHGARLRIALLGCACSPTGATWDEPAPGSRGPAIVATVSRGARGPAAPGPGPAPSRRARRRTGSARSSPAWPTAAAAIVAAVFLCSHRGRREPPSAAAPPARTWPRSGDHGHRPDRRLRRAGLPHRSSRPAACRLPTTGASYRKAWLRSDAGELVPVGTPLARATWRLVVTLWSGVAQRRLELPDLRRHHRATGRATQASVAQARVPRRRRRPGG